MQTAPQDRSRQELGSPDDSGGVEGVAGLQGGGDRDERGDFIMMPGRAGTSLNKRFDDGGGWQPIATAPRDGTWIEIKNSYGVAPWYSLARWSNETRFGASVYRSSTSSWVTQNNGGIPYESFLTWRPYSGELDGYVDPTRGAQSSAQYWRDAVAAKRGAPATPTPRQDLIVYGTLAVMTGVGVFALALAVGEIFGVIR